MTLSSKITKMTNAASAIPSHMTQRLFRNGRRSFVGGVEYGVGVSTSAMLSFEASNEVKTSKTTLLSRISCHRANSQAFLVVLQFSYAIPRLADCRLSPRSRRFERIAPFHLLEFEARAPARLSEKRAATCAVGEDPLHHNGR